MKIEVTARVFSFGEIRVGDVFEFDDNIYMKTVECRSCYLDSKDYVEMNAVILQSGSFVFFADEDKVTPVDGKLVVYQH